MRDCKFPSNNILMDSEQKKRLIFNGELENFPVWWERFPDGENEPKLQPLRDFLRKNVHFSKGSLLSQFNAPFCDAKFFA